MRLLGLSVRTARVTRWGLFLVRGGAGDDHPFFFFCHGISLSYPVWRRNLSSWSCVWSRQTLGLVEVVCIHISNSRSETFRPRQGIGERRDLSSFNDEQIIESSTEVLQKDAL